MKPEGGRTEGEREMAGIYRRCRGRVAHHTSTNWRAGRVCQFTLCLIKKYNWKYHPNSASHNCPRHTFSVCVCVCDIIYNIHYIISYFGTFCSSKNLLICEVGERLTPASGSMIQQKGILLAKMLLKRNKVAGRHPAGR